jgi:hypothetical protein
MISAGEFSPACLPVAGGMVGLAPARGIAAQPATAASARMTSARSSALVGDPTWSATTAISSRSRDRRSMVFTKLAPKGGATTIHCRDTSRSSSRGPLEALLGAPAELALDLGRIDRVAAVVAGAVGDEGDELAPAAAVGERALGVEHVADRLDDLQVGALGAAADIVAFADRALRQTSSSARA